MTEAQGGYRLGVDVGGTFTDLFLWSDRGEARTFKALTTPSDPSLGVMDGLAQAAGAMGLEPGEFLGRLGTIVHGTTVTTNAVLTRGGARTALVTTEGVRDALEMRRGIRESQYDNRLRNVEPLVPRRLRLPVRGRLDPRGEELEPLDLEGVRSAARRAAAEGVEAVAVCFMHSYASDVHERAAGRALVEELGPGRVFLSLSSRVLPTVRFYNRVSTTVLDAYVGPVLAVYLGRLTGRLREAGFRGVLLVMQSTGGVASPELAAQRPATTLLSGPAAGPRGALACAGPEAEAGCLVVDMGGTSFDASLVRGGRVELKAEGEIERLRIALPMLDIVTIGAGGGSLGWIDAGGLLRMGPASAGARPGPACYGCGGTRPTCTDADLVLGYLDPAWFAGGRLRLEPERALEAIEREVARPLGLGVEEAAAGMVRVIDSNMAHGVRQVTVRRGLDPREFPLLVAGGAGPLHACAIARELGIRRVLVPATASTLCASGMLFSDLQHDLARSWVTPLAEADREALRGRVEEMVAEGEALLDREGVGPERREHHLAFDLRYRKQYHEVTVPVSLAALRRLDLAEAERAFHAEHDRLYGYELSAEGTPLELITVRLRSVGRVERPVLPRLEPGGPEARAALKGRRRAYVAQRERFEEVPVYDGHRLRAGNALEGPALVERTDTTVVLGAAFHAEVDALGTLVLEGRSLA